MKQYITLMRDPMLGMAAMNTAQNAVGAGMGLILQGINDRRQLRQQEKLQNLQIKGQQQMVDYNYAKELQMWKDTNYRAQMAELKAAGLNPALMYKQGGPGGITGQPVGSVQGGAAPAGGMEIMNMMMTKAQMELIKAQTDKTKAETVNVPLTGQNIQADTKVKEVTEENMNIANEIAGATQNAQKALIFQAMRRSWEELEMVQEQNQWNEKQLEENFKLTTANIVETYAKAQLAEKQKGLASAQIGQIAEQIKQAWSQIDINATDVQIKQQIADFTTSMGPQAASIAGDILQFMLGMWKGNNRTTKGRGGK